VDALLGIETDMRLRWSQDLLRFDRVDALLGIETMDIHAVPGLDDVSIEWMPF
jgi:hypothetical protein